MVTESNRRFDPAPTWWAALEAEALDERARMGSGILQCMSNLGIGFLPRITWIRI